MAYYTEQYFLLSTLNIFHLFYFTKSKEKMIHIDKLQLGQIVQKWDKMAKHWDKLVGTNLTWDKLTRHQTDAMFQLGKVVFQSYVVNYSFMGS